MKMVIAIYNHQEYYPPTLNALEELSKSCDKIYLLGRNIKTSNWIYPKNVEIKLSGSYKTVNEIREASLIWKILSFARFTFNLFLLIIKHKPKWVVCYDSIPLWAFRIATKFIFFKIPKLWYHNHDVIDGHHKFSVSWWASSRIVISWSFPILSVSFTPNDLFNALIVASILSST